MVYWLIPYCPTTNSLLVGGSGSFPRYGSVAGAGPIGGKHAGGPDWARTTVMERIAPIEVKLYQKANAYHHKTYAVYNGAHGPIRPPAASAVARRGHPPSPRCNRRANAPGKQVTRSTDVPIVRSPDAAGRGFLPGLKAGA